MGTPKDILNLLVAAGEKKAKLSTGKRLILAILGGAFVALASVGANTAMSLIDNYAVAKLVGALIFPTGLIMILIAGAELLTGNCLVIVSVLDKKIKWTPFFKCLLFAFTGNFIGSVLIAFLVVKSGQFSLFHHSAIAVSAIKTASAKAAISFDSAILMGILCNVLVCVAIWIGTIAKSITDKILGIFFPIFLFVLSGYEHCVANMYYMPAGLFAMQNSEYAAAAAEAGIDTGTLTWGNFLFSNLLPVTIGNIIGGVILVGGVYWYIYADKKEK